MKRTSKTFSCTWLLIHLLFAKRTVPLRESHTGVITLLMANIVWKMLIAQIYLDFHGALGRPYMHKKNIQTSKNNI